MVVSDINPPKLGPKPEDLDCGLSKEVGGAQEEYSEGHSVFDTGFAQRYHQDAAKAYKDFLAKTAPICDPATAPFFIQECLHQLGKYIHGFGQKLAGQVFLGKHLTVYLTAKGSCGKERQ